MPAERSLDYRFSLANERTFLASTRTSLALMGGGVAFLHLLADSVPGFVAAYALVAMGVMVSLAGLRRWIRNGRAILHGLPLDETVIPIFLVIGITVVGVLLVVD